MAEAGYIEIKGNYFIDFTDKINKNGKEYRKLYYKDIYYTNWSIIDGFLKIGENIVKKVKVSTGVGSSINANLVSGDIIAEGKVFYILKQKTKEEVFQNYYRTLVIKKFLKKIELVK